MIGALGIKTEFCFAESDILPVAIVTKQFSDLSLFIISKKFCDEGY